MQWSWAITNSPCYKCQDSIWNNFIPSLQCSKKQFKTQIGEDHMGYPFNKFFDKRLFCIFLWIPFIFISYKKYLWSFGRFQTRFHLVQCRYHFFSYCCLRSLIQLCTKRIFKNFVNLIANFGKSHSLRCFLLSLYLPETSLIYLGSIFCLDLLFLVFYFITPCGWIVFLHIDTFSRYWHSWWRPSRIVKYKQ